MSAQSDLAAAKRYAASHRSSGNVDLDSRVVMFQRAMSKEHGSERAANAHARSLVRHLRQTGVEIPKAPAKKAAAKKSTS
jgi:hypothetical protein